MIKNITKDIIISHRNKLLKNTLQHAIGLMFQKPKTLIFQFKSEKFTPLHMFFVFCTIDVLFLDKNKKIVEMKENFKPFTFYNPRKKSQYIIELPENTITTTKTEINDLISF